MPVSIAAPFFHFVYATMCEDFNIYFINKYRQTKWLDSLLSWCFVCCAAFDFGLTFIFLHLFVRRCFSEVLCWHREEWMEVGPACWLQRNSFFLLAVVCVYSARCPCVLAHAHWSSVVSSAWYRGHSEGWSQQKNKHLSQTYDQTWYPRWNCSQGIYTYIFFPVPTNQKVQDVCKD